MDEYTMGQLLAEHEQDWDIGYAPAGGDRWILRSVRRDGPQVTLAADSAAELRDAIDAWKAGQ